MQTIRDLPANLKRLFHGHPQAVVIWLVFIALAVIYSLATPPFEAGDESRHYAVVKYMAETGRLPVQNVPQTGQYQIHWSHEGNQPPLYYALAALPAAWIDTDPWEQVFQYNPHTTIGNPLRSDNKNITIHPPTKAWSGHVLAVHLIRLLSIAMGCRNRCRLLRRCSGPVQRQSLAGGRRDGYYRLQSHVHLYLSRRQQ